MQVNNAKQIIEVVSMCVFIFGVVFEWSFVFLPNVPSQESPLASGMASAREAELAEAMPEVPKGR